LEGTIDVLPSHRMTVEDPSAAAVTDTWENMIAMNMAQEEDIKMRRVDAAHDGGQQPIMDKVRNLSISLSTNGVACHHSRSTHTQNVPKIHVPFIYTWYTYFNVYDV
jgi:hypothetical protein